MKLKQAQRIVREHDRLRDEVTTLESGKAELQAKLDSYDKDTVEHFDATVRAARVEARWADDAFAAMIARHVEERRELAVKHAAEHAKVEGHMRSMHSGMKTAEQAYDARQPGKATLTAEIQTAAARIERTAKERDKYVPQLDEARKMCAEIATLEAARVERVTLQKRLRDEYRAKQVEAIKTSPIILSIPKTLSAPRHSLNRRG